MKNILILLFVLVANAFAATTTSNMSLSVPSVGDTDYPTSISNSFNSIDAHDHTSGKGVQIPTGGISDSAVTTAKIADSNITTNKLAANSVTQAKRAALGHQLSSSSGSFSTSNITATDITNLSVTITTTGRPVFIGLIHDENTTNSPNQGCGLFAESSGSVTSVVGTFYILEGSTVISYTYLRNDGSSSNRKIYVPCSSLWTIRVPAAGTYTYKVQASASASTSVGAAYSKLIAYEL